MKTKLSTKNLREMKIRIPKEDKGNSYFACGVKEGSKIHEVLLEYIRKRKVKITNK